ncbi:hypothetical protein AYO20_03365 [Fonsecaea nubica]|uniref:Uncharacterized protein n=1 Tax=Fonsecaea nubica TaxID=856822 RepID=A0A178D504_9EURO|nr:hypothetical protein AYO20_03365 [Fonsecaea nubica]OAL37189.1 hypothetical protein AYO20_03365 [Fonsecaea nubica]
MGKNNSKKAARHARITQDFFNQVPESSTEESAKTTAERPSISLPTQVARALNSFVNTSNIPNPTILSGTFQQIDLGDDYRQVACLLGERVFHTFERSKDAARDLLRHFFTTAYLTVDQSTGKREWRVDTDVKIEIVHAIKTNKFIGLFTSQRPVKGTNPVEFEDVIDSPSFLDEFDVIGIIVDFFFDWAVECAEFLRRNPDHKAVDIPFKTYVEHYRPFTCIGIIEIAAAIRNGKTIDIDPRPLEFFIAVRMNNMADEQNLFIQGKPKKTGRKNNKNKGEAKVKATEPDSTTMEHTAKPVEKKQDDKDDAADMDVAAKPAEDKHDKDNATDMDVAPKAVEKKQVDKDHTTKKNVTVKGAKDLEDDKEDTSEDDAAAATAAAESTVTKVESTAEDVKGKQVNKDNITLPAATAATGRTITVTPDDHVATMTSGVGTATTGRNIPVTPDDHVATLTAGARTISINDTRTDEDPYGLRNRRSRWSTTAHGSATNNSTAEDDDPLNLRARSRLPAASVIHTDMFTDADGPTPTGPPIPGPATTGRTSAGTRSGYPDLETIRARRHERIRERLARHGANFPTATTATAATATTATATDAPGTDECTAPPPRVRPGRRQASAATAGSSTTQQPRAAEPRETATQRLAKNRLYQELQDLVNTNFPSAAARRTAFAQARQRLLHSETVAAARGEQPLRATATRATQEALTIGRDDALNAVRQQRAAEAARMRASRAGTEANARAREQGFGFDIGGMGGWYGELEAMQIQGLDGNKATGKKEDEAKEK